jgi:hypothetical protein
MAFFTYNFFIFSATNKEKQVKYEEIQGKKSGAFIYGNVDIVGVSDSRRGG